MPFNKETKPNQTKQIILFLCLFLFPPSLSLSVYFLSLFLSFFVSDSFSFSLSPDLIWYNLIYKKVGSSCVMVNVLDCKLEASEFELQLRYYVHFRTQTLEKLLVLLLWVK